MVPYASKKECSWSGCHQTTAHKYCEAHERLAKEVERVKNKKRGSAKQRGYNDPEWHQKRQAVIARDKGICQRCFKPVEEPGDVHIDHKISRQDWKRQGREGDPEHMSNLQLLHNGCHSSKTLAERRARGEHI